MASYTLAQEKTELAGYVKVPFPKLKITEEWINRNKEIKLPEESHGKIVSILGTEEGKTLIATDENIVYEINGVLKGDYSEYEERYNNWKNRGWMGHYFKTEPIELPSFESLALPPFSSFLGTIKGSGSVLYTFKYNEQFDAIHLIWENNWNTDKLEINPKGTILATYTFPLQIKNRTPLIIYNYSLEFYLEDSKGERYYPKPDKLLPLKFIPIQIEQFLPEQSVHLNLKIKAPADDFSLNPYIDDGQFRRRLSKPIGYYNWEEEALKRTSFPAKEILRNLIEYLKYTSTKKGYDKILAKISFPLMRIEQYKDALCIVNKLLKENTINSKNFVKLQKNIAFIKLHNLKSAVIELSIADKDIMPISY